MGFQHIDGLPTHTFGGSEKVVEELHKQIVMGTTRLELGSFWNPSILISWEKKGNGDHGEQSSDEGQFDLQFYLFQEKFQELKLKKNKKWAMIMVALDMAASQPWLVAIDKKYY